MRLWTGPHRARAARGETHPVYDFLWHYYSVRPALLERWHPGLGVTLAGDGARGYLTHAGYTESAVGVTADARSLSAGRLESVRWIASLLRACTERPPVHSCFGLHEWAMVYRTDDIRHPATPLRFPPDELAAIVESMPVRCSHFDAFRFFTPAARPLNRLQPSRETRLELEQRGCLHANMDLYKWAVKLLPYAPSELVADCFALALAALQRQHRPAGRRRRRQ
ncbi:MAG: 3-methyladenine DNA glycosylase, partial [Opitutaceae bacterium]|nr:3-methyladenine DNA glycosylase [Opitutaceae bacterium]